MTKLKTCMHFLAAALLAAGCVQPLPLPPDGGVEDDDDDDDCGGKGGWGGSAGGGGGWGGNGGTGGWGGGGGSGGGLPEPLRTALSGDEVLAILRGDLATTPRAQQPNVRYVSLHTFYNDQRYSNTELGAAASAVSKLVNHLSPLGAAVTRPALVLADSDLPVAVRLELGAHDIDADDWSLLEAATEVPGRESPCAVPLLTVEQFLGVGSNDAHYQVLSEQFVSVYSNVVLRRALVDKGLLAPGQLVFDPISKAQFIANGFTTVGNVGFPDVAAALGVDLAADLASGDRNVVQRACALNSGLSVNARCAERHATPDAPGPGLWWTMDFLAPDAAANDAFASPIGPSNGNLVDPEGETAFALEGGEALWSWPNGLLGFASFNGNLDLVSAPPILNGLNSAPETSFLASTGTCFSCHASAIIPMTDALFERAIESNGEYSEAELSFILKRVPPQDELNARFDLDAQAYRSALRDAYYKVGPDGDLPDGVYTLGSHYQFDLAIDQVSAALAVDAPQLLDLLDSGDFGTVREQLLNQGAISRETFTVFSHELYQALGSPPESLLGACVTRSLADGEETGD